MRRGESSDPTLSSHVSTRGTKRSAGSRARCESNSKKQQIKRSESLPTELQMRGILKVRNLDESLHSTYGSEGSPSANIRFDDIEIREYCRTVGDHPSCSSGPPVTLDWKYNPNTKKYTVDDFEKKRGGRRRDNFEMILPRMARHDMLKKEWNVSQAQIAAAVRSTIKVKSQRRTTVNNLGRTSQVEELIEKVNRKVLRTLLFKKSTKQQVQELSDRFDEIRKLREEKYRQMGYEVGIKAMTAEDASMSGVSENDTTNNSSSNPASSISSNKKPIVATEQDLGPENDLISKALAKDSLSQKQHQRATNQERHRVTKPQRKHRDVSPASSTTVPIELEV